MDKKMLKKILNDHLKWLNSEEDGHRADLRGADLRGADLRGANLCCADLCCADLCCADLYGADLRGADLSGAQIRSANLYGANLRDAFLHGTDLRSAYIRNANIPIELINKFFPICCPEYGAFVSWKKVSNDLIVKLLIPEDAKRSSALGRKCRCSKAVCLAIETENGEKADCSEVASRYDPDFIYRVGEMIEVPNFDEDRLNECSTGIHFFITRQEAVDYC